MDPRLLPRALAPQQGWREEGVETGRILTLTSLEGKERKTEKESKKEK